MRLEDVSRGNVLGELDVAAECRQVERLVTATADDDVFLHRAGDVEQGPQRKLGGDLLLQRLQEELLALHAVEIGVEVAVADVRERVVSAHALVARPQVDRGVTARPRVIVEVPVIDVEPDSAELVDELQEAVEVDGDEVVDRKARERLHGLETSERTTLRERGVDPIVVDEPSRTVNRDDQIARER